MALLIQQVCEERDHHTSVIVDRHTLYKRRWRAKAEDGSDLAINLDRPVGDGAYLDGGESGVFKVQQLDEEVLVIPLPKSTELAAKVGWYLGNQHLPVEVREQEILLENVKTLAASLDRIGIPYTIRRDVFRCKMHSHTH